MPLKGGEGTGHGLNRLSTVRTHEKKAPKAIELFSRGQGLNGPGEIHRICPSLPSFTAMHCNSIQSLPPLPSSPPSIGPRGRWEGLMGGPMGSFSLSVVD